MSEISNVNQQSTSLRRTLQIVQFFLDVFNQIHQIVKFFDNKITIFKYLMRRLVEYYAA